ncbi:hypothetical protein BMA10399_C0118 [Burkholderia mallei ATCC 10399]|nr:hypothetical protein BMA10399_C0118 [Burkholderia mallei ATCC 10399]
MSALPPPPLRAFGFDRWACRPTPRVMRAASRVSRRASF